MFHIEESILDRGRGDELRKGDGCEVREKYGAVDIYERSSIKIASASL